MPEVTEDLNDVIASAVQARIEAEVVTGCFSYAPSPKPEGGWIECGCGERMASRADDLHARRP